MPALSPSSITVLCGRRKDISCHRGGDGIGCIARQQVGELVTAIHAGYGRVAGAIRNTYSFQGIGMVINNVSGKFHKLNPVLRPKLPQPGQLKLAALCLPKQNYNWRQYCLLPPGSSQSGKTNSSQHNNPRPQESALLASLYSIRTKILPPTLSVRYNDARRLNRLFHRFRHVDKHFSRVVRKTGRAPLFIQGDDISSHPGNHRPNHPGLASPAGRHLQGINPSSCRKPCCEQ